MVEKTYATTFSCTPLGARSVRAYLAHPVHPVGLVTGVSTDPGSAVVHADALTDTRQHELALLKKASVSDCNSSWQVACPARLALTTLCACPRQLAQCRPSQAPVICQKGPVGPPVWEHLPSEGMYVRWGLCCKVLPSSWLTASHRRQPLTL